MNIYSNHNRNHEQSMKLQPQKQVDRQATAWVVVAMHRSIYVRSMSEGNEPDMLEPVPTNQKNTSN